VWHPGERERPWESRVMSGVPADSSASLRYGRDDKNKPQIPHPKGVRDDKKSLNREPQIPHP